MKGTPSRFVVSKKNITLPDGVSVEKDDVGILDSTIKENNFIFFVRAWRKIELTINDFYYINVHETGDAFQKKICNVCHKLKSTLEFSKNQNAKNNRSVRRPSCKDCRVEMEGIGVSRANRVKWLKAKPNYKPFECPICKKRTIAGVTSKVVLEHNHQTGKPGAWICDSCNTGLGRFKDNIQLLENAIGFLKETY